MEKEKHRHLNIKLIGKKISDFSGSDQSTAEYMDMIKKGRRRRAYELCGRRYTG